MADTATTARIENVKIVNVFVSDQQRALEWYRDKLGFEVHTDATMGDFRWIEMSPEGSQTHVTLMRQGTGPETSQKMGEYVGFNFGTSDVQGTYEALGARGVEFESEPKHEPWGSYVNFRDPDGNQHMIASND